MAVRVVAAPWVGERQGARTPPLTASHLSFGPVCVIAPFNFPLEIPVLQLMGALYMGNKPVVKADSKVSIVVEQYLRMLIECGMPATDVDLIHSDG